MDEAYDRRQTNGQWPRRGRWSPDGLPGWYLDLIGAVAHDLTAWREHDPGQRLDPRCDPRQPQRHQSERRAIR
jgi:hypothetical protein